MSESLPRKENQPNAAHLYNSWLMRVWRQDIDGPWRIQLKHVLTQKTETFFDLSGLVDFLQQDMDRADAERNDQLT